jgi:hypothetical protein
VVRDGTVVVRHTADARFHHGAGKYAIYENDVKVAVSSEKQSNGKT